MVPVRHIGVRSTQHTVPCVYRAPTTISRRCLSTLSHYIGVMIIMANQNPFAATRLTNGVNMPWIVPIPFITVPVDDMTCGNIAIAILELIKLPIL